MAWRLLQYQEFSCSGTFKFGIKNLNIRTEPPLMVFFNKWAFIERGIVSLLHGLFRTAGLQTEDACGRAGLIDLRKLRLEI